MKTATRFFASAVVALVAGLTIFQLEILFRTPVFWAGLDPLRPNWMQQLLILGTLYLAVPLVVAVAIFIWRKDRFSLLACCGVHLSWVVTVCLVWARKPWSYYGEFPWWMMERDLVPAAGAALAVAWVFWRIARACGPTHHSTGPARKAAQGRLPSR